MVETTKNECWWTRSGLQQQQEVVSQVMNELGSKSVSSASSVFAKATLPEHFVTWLGT